MIGLGLYLCYLLLERNVAPLDSSQLLTYNHGSRESMLSFVFKFSRHNERTRAIRTDVVPMSYLTELGPCCRRR